MDDIRRIRRRIHHTQKNRTFSWMYRMMIVFMCGISIMLAGLIVTETDYHEAKAVVSQYLKEIDLGEIVVFENWFLPSVDTVNSDISYQKLDEHYFVNSTNMVYAIADGVVVYVNETNSGFQMIVKNDNQILVTYANMSDIHVKVEDRVLMHSVIGTYQDKLYMDFMEDQVFITYEEAVSKN